MTRNGSAARYHLRVNPVDHSYHNAMPTLDRYAVIGHPISHSQSPWIHNWFAKATAQPMVYEAIDGGETPQSFELALRQFRTAGGKGMNVTLPFKLHALRLADMASDDARAAGAANALRFVDDFVDEYVEANNFDGIGLVRDIEVNHHRPLSDQRLLLLGAGGATRGVLLPLARAGAVQIVVANRTYSKTEALVHELAPHLPRSCELLASELLSLAQRGAFDVVINATSASLSDQAPCATREIFGSQTLAYDMVYGKGLTPFLKLAQMAGCAQLVDGTGMLVEQAAESFAWWRGVRPETSTILEQLKTH